jgi:ABC-type glycerol-3-phosphate transport system substrate-binding protein
MATVKTQRVETRRPLTRRTLASAALPALPVLVVACAGTDSGGKAPPANQPATLVLHTDWVPPGVRGDITTQGLEEYARRFPNVKVTPEPLGAADTAEKLSALIAADSIGDVALWTHHLVVYFAKRSFFTDLRPYLKTFKFSLDDVYYIPEICTYENKLLAVPFQLNMFDWTYNKTLFRQLGVAPPADTWTVDQMLTAARALTQSEKNVWGLDWNITTGNPNLWITPIRANGGTLLNQAFTKTTLNDPVAVDTLQLLVDVINKHQVAPSRALVTERSLSFAKGNMAMAFGQGVGRTLIKQMADAGMEWDFFYSPTWPRTAKRAVQANLQPLVVPNSKKQIDHAAQLAFYFGGEYVQGLVADIGNTAPTLKKLIDSDRYLPSSHRRKVPSDGNAYRWGMGSGFEYYTPWRNAVQAEIFKGWDGQVSARAAAEAATAAGDAALAAAGVKVG